MSVLRIQLFGGIQLIDQQQGAIPLQPTVQIFLAYLLLNRHRSHCREVLTGLFWGDREESQARRCLSTALWRLRQDLEPEGTPRGTFVITNPSGEIGFNCQDGHVWLDVAAFEEKANAGLDCAPADMGMAECIQLEEAAELYTGDLLEGFYPDWVLQQRERYRSQYIGSLSRLMHYHSAQRAYEQGIYYGRKILALDPLREEVHRELMRLYEQNGERPQAVQQYESCCQILAEELEIDPMPETQALYKHLTAARSQILTPDLNKSKTQKPENLQQALLELDQALFNLDEIRGQLHQARQVVSHFLNR